MQNRIKNFLIALYTGRETILWVIVIAVIVFLMFGFFSGGKDTSKLVTELTDKIQKEVDAQFSSRMIDYENKLKSLDSQLTASKKVSNQLQKDIGELKNEKKKNIKPTDRPAVYHLYDELGYPPVR